MEQTATKDRQSTAAITQEPALTILDTNVVLDWLVFDEPRTRALVAAITEGRLRWLTTAAILGELRHVFSGFVDSRWHPRPNALEEACARWALVAEAPSVARTPRCSDPDDQIFINLALAHCARWLVTRDRALLRMARHMRPRGTEVLTPAAWAAAA